MDQIPATVWSDELEDWIVVGLDDEDDPLFVLTGDTRMGPDGPLPVAEHRP